MTQEQVLILEEEGMLPEDFEWDRDAEWVHISIRPRGSRGLAMGYKNSCAIATKLGRVITRMWRERGIKLANLLDDVLNMHVKFVMRCWQTWSALVYKLN